MYKYGFQLDTPLCTLIADKNFIKLLIMDQLETLKGEGKNTFRGKSVVGTDEAKIILDCSTSKLDDLCTTNTIPFSKPKTTNSRGETVEGRKRYFLVSDLYAYMLSNYSESI